MKIGENESKQNHCVKVRELFRRKIVSIESEFAEGFSTQVIWLATAPKNKLFMLPHARFG